MDEVRDKLIELLQDCDCPYPCKAADHLIANGVTIQRWIPVTERKPTAADADAKGKVFAYSKV